MSNPLGNIVIFLIVLYKTIMYYPFIDKYILYFLILTIGILTILQIYNKKYSKKVIARYAIVLLFAILSILNTASVNFFFPLCILFIYDNNTECYKKIARSFFWSLTACFVITTILNTCGVLSGITIHRYEELRYSLGFLHPNFVGLYFVFICISAYLGFNNGKKIILYLAPLAIILYKISLSRIGLIGYILLVLISLIPKNKTTDKIIKKVALYLFPLLTILTILLVQLYAQCNLSQLNELLSGRLLHYSVYIENGLLTSLTGLQKIGTYTIDNYYLYFFYDYGIIGFLLWLIINHVSIKKMEDNTILRALIVVFICGLSESNVVITSFNCLLTIQIMHFFKPTTNAMLNKSPKALLEDMELKNILAKPKS